jgi:hypothetical protein
VAQVDGLPAGDHADALKSRSSIHFVLAIGCLKENVASHRRHYTPAREEFNAVVDNARKWATLSPSS